MIFTAPDCMCLIISEYQNYSVLTDFEKLKFKSCEFLNMEKKIGNGKQPFPIRLDSFKNSYFNCLKINSCYAQP